MWLITFPGITARFHGMSRTGATVTRVLLALLLFLPVVAGAVYTVVTDTDLTVTSTARSAGEPATGTDVAQTVPNGNNLVAARRAAGEADTQAGFLVAGTGELNDGVEKLDDGSRRLSEGVTEAADGSQRLTDGLIRLQAGTGQLGDGAAQVADGVARAVEQIEAMPGARDDLLGVLDEVDATLATSDHPDAAQLRMELVKLRVEVVNFRLDPGMLGQLNELRDGSRQVADQLSKPGQPFHDGVYSAVTGSRSLTGGLRELDEGTRTLREGVGELRDGAARIHAMAEANENKVDAFRSGLPARETPGAAGAEESRSTPETNVVPGSGGMNAFFAALLVWLAATSLWLIVAASPARSDGGGRRPGPTQILPVIGIAAVGAVFVATVARPTGAVALTGSILVVTLAAVAAAVSGRAVIGLLGGTVGRIALVLGLIAQVGIVGHVFSAIASGETVTASWRLATALTPVGYPVAALTELDSGGSGPVLWVAVAVLGALVLLGAVTGRFAPAVERSSGTAAGGPGDTVTVGPDPGQTSAHDLPSRSPEAP